VTKEERHAQQAVLERLRQDASLLARVFGLGLRSLEAERPNVRRRYGVCYSDGSIRIRLHHARTRKTLKYSSLVDTLCHELAHLRHFSHDGRFRSFYFRILEYARQRGIYRPDPLRRKPEPPCEREPTPPRPARPVQLTLFGSRWMPAPTNIRQRDVQQRDIQQRARTVRRIGGR
jgi:hypothetical protein